MKGVKMGIGAMLIDIDKDYREIIAVRRQEVEVIDVINDVIFWHSNLGIKIKELM